ncbi:MAG: fibronectin type III domain-containing protein [Verrucomicrobiia bacterium]
MNNFMRAILKRGKIGFAVAALIALAMFYANGQNIYTVQQNEYAIVGTNRGDQVFASIAITTNGGYLVWQDNSIDGIGWGIAAQRLDSTLSGQYGSFRVNQQSIGDQMRPRVLMFSNGGAVIAWEGSQTGNKDIYAVFLSPGGTFITGDVRVNSYTNNDQTDVALCRLSGDRALIAWSSFEQDGSYQGVYGRIFNSSGQPLGAEFLINQTTNYSQRLPSVTTLANGNFVAVWISELQRSDRSVDVYGRVFDGNGQPLGNEFLINTGTNICGHPEVVATADGGFVVVWGERSAVVRDPTPNLQVNGWDVFARIYTAGLKPVGQPIRVNQFIYGDQIAPRVAAIGNDLMIVWTSVGQDGSREGVFGRFMDYNGNFTGNEFQVNTTTISSQIQPVVASDNDRRFLVVWSSFTGLDFGMDLGAQRYALVSAPLPAPPAPFVSALSQSRLSVSWSPITGFDISGYEVFIDGSTNGIPVSANYYTVSGLAPSTVHSFAIVYILSDGRRSPVSPVATGKTWGEDNNMDGLPDDWQAQYFGSNPAIFPAANVDSDGDGASNLQEFLAGTNPVDPRSVLRTRIVRTPQGRFLHWSAQPGFVYQVQTTTNLTGWTNLGQPRFASGYEDSILLQSQSNSAAFYRVIRIR